MEIFSLPVQDPIPTFCVILILLLFAPFAAEKLRLPGSIGLVLAGVLVGPSGLGILGLDATIKLLGSIGLLYVVFMAGLDMDLALLSRNRKNIVLSGLVSFVLPFAAGFALGKGMLGMETSGALILGAVFSAHTLIPFPIVGTLGLSQSRSALAASGSGIFANSLALLAVAAVSLASNATQKLPSLPLLALSSAAYFIGAFLIVPRLASWFFRKVKPGGIVDFSFILAMLFLNGVFAIAVGLEPIVGALLTGILLNIPAKSSLMNRIRFTDDALFSPFFFVSVGMLSNPRLFVSDPKILLVALVILIAAAAAKYLSALVVKPILVFSWAETNLLFGLTASKASLALAAVYIGAGLGVVDASVLNGTMLAIVLSSLIGQAAAGKSAKKLALEEKTGNSGRAELSERIMVPVANPEAASNLVSLAIMLRPKNSENPIYPINVVQDSPDADRDIVQAEKILAQILVQGAASGVPVTPVTKVALNGAEGLLQAVQDIRISTILMGWSGVPKLSNRLFGGIIDQVVMESRSSVIVSKLPKPPKSIQTIVAILPPLIERQDGFLRAMGQVKRLAEGLSAKLQVWSLSHSIEAIKAETEKAFPAHPVQYRDAESWDAFFLSLPKNPKSGCAYVLLNVRPGRLAWQPAVDKVPSRISEECPESALLILYLSEETQATGETPDSPPSASLPASVFATALKQNRIVLNMGKYAVADAIREMLATCFGSEKAVLRRLSAAFAEIAQKEPVELKPGVVLLHSHVDEVSEPTIIIGASPDGFRLGAASEPVKVMIILLAPSSKPPEEHLKTLAGIARLVKDDRFVEMLSSARTPADLAGLD